MWRIDMLGGLRAVHADRVVARFRTRKTGALLAYLAFHRGRSQPRELLLEILWPEEQPDKARMWLRTALASLRRQLEPPGVAAGAVIVADRLSVSLDPRTVITDVAQFESALQAANRLPWGCERTEQLTTAIHLYSGALLPGYFESWVLPEQQRLTGLLVQALRHLTEYLVRIGDLSAALDVAGRAVAADPLREELHRELIRLYGAAGQTAAAVRQFQELEQRLREEIGEAPSQATRRLVSQIQSGDFSPLAPTSGPPPAAWPSDGAQPGFLFPVIGTAASPAGVSETANGHIPPQITRFFGRQTEISAIRKLLLADGVRLVTLTGPGGCGKTRLALEVATRLRESLEGAVWFVPLAEVHDPRSIIDTIHTALHLPRLEQVEPFQQVVNALSRRPALLLLDNFEQLMPDGVPVVRDLLQHAPMLQCLLTSRHILELPPEREITVGPLPVPGVQVFRRSGVQEPAAQDLNTLLQCESVALFVDRAQRVQPYFQLTRSNATALVELCRRLEGIPLAIELAAARSNRLTPGRMLSALERRFDLLISRQRDLPSRHQTLRAAIEWSYRLLSPAVQCCFAQLSVFRGGWTREAAEAVCELASGDEKGSVPGVVACLEQLQQCSLVLVGEDETLNGTAGRYRLLETVREFASEQLTREDEALRRQQHAAFYLRLAEDAEAGLVGPDQREWLARLQADSDNLRAALGWCVEQQEGEVGLRIARGLVRFWSWRGHHQEGREWLTRLLALPWSNVSPRARVRALDAAAELAILQGDATAARSLLAEGLSICRRLKDNRCLADLLDELARLATFQGRYGRAVRYVRRSLALYRELGDTGRVATCLHNLGYAAIFLRDYDTARARLEEARSLFEEIGMTHLLATALNNLGTLELRQENVAAARSALTKSLAIRRELGDLPGIAFTMYCLASVMAARQDEWRAVRLLSAAEALSTSFGVVRGGNFPLDSHLHEELQTRLGTERFLAAWSEGRSMLWERMVGDVLGEDS